MSTLRVPQQAAYDAIQQHDRGIIKMFCGTGKTRVIFKVIIDATLPISLIVFPRIALVEQFRRDYVQKWTHDLDTIYICSKTEASHTDFTTDEDTITEFLMNESSNKLICCTYQSLQTLIDALELCESSIDLAIYDEGHHCVAPATYDLLTYGPLAEAGRSYFFTATPNETMDADEDEIFGPILFTYTHRDAVEDRICNDFEIICRFALPAEYNIYEHMAAAYARTPNGRMLVFHSFAEAEVEGRTSVVQFSGAAAQRQCAAAFNPKTPKLSAVIAKTKDKDAILTAFEATSDDAISILHNCSILGEGIDTKAANAIVFADPKASTTAIIQNIGRATRLPEGVRRPASIIIPVVVDIEKFNVAATPEERHRLICDEFTKGNFQAIQNVLSALRQEDEEIMDAILRSPNRYTRAEVERTFSRAGYVATGEAATIGELCGLSAEATADEVAVTIERPLEIHSGDMEEPIRKVGSGDNTLKVMHLDETWTKMEGSDAEVKAPRRPLKVRYDFSDNLGLQWDTISGVRDIGSAVIDCNCIDGEERAMMRAKKCVEWYKANKRLPVASAKRRNNSDESSIIEARHGEFIVYQKKLIKEHKLNYDSVVKYLTANIPEWNKEIDLEQDAISRANECIIWFNSNKRLPSPAAKKRKDITNKDIEEAKNGGFLAEQRKILKGKSKSVYYKSVIDLLNAHIPNWSTCGDFEALAMKQAEEVVSWYNRYQRYPTDGASRRKCRGDETTKDLLEEAMVGKFLSRYKMVLNGTGPGSNYARVTEYLNKNLPQGWHQNKDLETQALMRARELINWIRDNNGNYPSQSAKRNKVIKKETLTEYSLAKFLQGQREASHGKGTNILYHSVKVLFDSEIPGWNDDLETKALQKAKLVVSWIKTNERYPRERAVKQDGENKDTIIEEKYAQFISGQRMVFRGKARCEARYESVLNYLNLHIPGWAQTLEDKSLENANLLYQWYQTHQRLPSISARKRKLKSNETENDINEEMKYGYYIQAQRSALKGLKGILYPSVKTYLDKHIPGWSGDDTSSVSSVENTIVQPRRRKFKLPNPEAEPSGKQQVISKIGAYHKRFHNLNSATYYDEIRSNPATFREYHAIADRLDAKDVPEQQVMGRVAALCAKLPPKCRVVDLGCGMNRLRTLVPNCNWTSIDAVAADETVQVADIAALPFDDNHFQAAVLSRALWGRDHAKQMAEAFRVLNYGAPLFICESRRRWTREDGTNQLLEDLKTTGFHIKVEPKTNDEVFQYIVAQKPALI